MEDDWLSWCGCCETGWQRKYKDRGTRNDDAFPRFCRRGPRQFIEIPAVESKLRLESIKRKLSSPLFSFALFVSFAFLLAFFFFFELPTPPRQTEGGWKLNCLSKLSWRNFRSSFPQFSSARRITAVTPKVCVLAFLVLTTNGSYRGTMKIDDNRSLRCAIANRRLNPFSLFAIRDFILNIPVI